MGFFDKLKLGLTKTKESINEKINDVFSNFRKVDEEFLEELEEVRRLNINSESEIEFENNIDDEERKDIVLYLEEMSESDAKELEEIDTVLEQRNKENERYEESIGIDC